MSEVSIDGVVIKPLPKFVDPRGWLTELYRDDELPVGFEPTMCYISVTRPGVARGPHEHVDQSDGFAFVSGSFQLFLWENRPGKPAAKMLVEVGEANPAFVVVPPGVVHAYRNSGAADAFVLNFPDRLYRGAGKSQPVDEIRHEDDADTRFQL
jgi:dTDP-4-dehydrorhamnose 3,5-epimerase